LETSYWSTAAPPHFVVYDAALGGEMSGHIFFADRYFGYDDAIYAACRMLEIVAKVGRPLSELLADLPPAVNTPEIRVDCPDDVKFTVVSAVTKRYKDKGYPVLDIDGARITFPGTGAAPKWGLVRASNTGPILVMRFEAGTEAELDEMKSEVETAVAEERQKLAG
jgi:phosphomannomutase/phosphoglucomutase